MTPQDFIRKWKHHALSERASAQEHFLDLCRLFDHPTPAEADPQAEFFTFEKGVPKTGGGDGFADVWKKGFFAWEYKKRRRNLDDALVQLVRYAAALENPPLHVVCDTIHFKIVTAWTNTVPKTYEFELEALTEPDNLRILRAVFLDPESLKPARTRAALTKEAADKFQTISDRLQHRNPAREAVAHFVNQLVFCFFADSVKLLPDGMWRRLLEAAEKRPQRTKDFLDKLFATMETGGEFDLTDIRWFNGGLFDGRRALPLEHGEIGLLFAAGSLDWSLIDPTIFGTLFERFLDPEKRAQIGAHYTDVEKIMMIVEPVILRPLRREWEEARAEIAGTMRPVLEATAPTSRGAQKDLGKKFEAARAKAELRRDTFLERLANLRILDPACGSGNFLYLALQGVRDIEYRAILECEEMMLHRVLPRVGPEILHGLEINPLAAELARMTIWIGDIQWEIRNAIFSRPEPILRKLDTIECRDALLTRVQTKRTYRESEWPQAEFIVGNPPFLGGKLLRRGLGDEIVDALFNVYQDRVPAEADLVCYWVVKAWESIEAGATRRTGLVTTNSIRGGANRKTLEPIAEEGAIFEAWSDEPWIVEGAAVRVSLICFGKSQGEKYLEGRPTSTINADVSGVQTDLTRARRLITNANIAFMGDTKGGAFDVPGDAARAWLMAPINPNGRPNSDVLKPWVNGFDVTRRSRDMWIIDFGWIMSEAEAALYQEPFAYALEKIKPERAVNRRNLYRMNWWRHVEPRPGLINRMRGLRRAIFTPRVAKYRTFTWSHSFVLPDSRLFGFVRDDDYFFGMLQNRFHEAWSIGTGSWHGVGNDPVYTPTTTFETFAFPEALTPNVRAAEYAYDASAIRIAAAAKRLDELRNAWLNPPDLVEIVPEVYPTAEMLAAGVKKIYPDRILPKNAQAAAILRERTLTNLYNERPRWLADAHDALDRAVAAAYGWPEDISTADALARLLELNLARSAAEAEARTKSARPSPRVRGEGGRRPDEGQH
jgi:type II restriction/modification system DNA methylase subunit YeeA